MSRSRGTTFSAHTALAIAAACALLTSLAPLRWVRWLGWFGYPADMCMAPLTQPLLALASLLQGPPRPDSGDAVVDGLRADLEHLATLYLRARADRDTLLSRIEDLQRGIALNPDLAVSQLTAPVVGVSADPASSLLKVRAGSASGVEVNSVAVVAGVHLVGRVSRADRRLSTITPITARASGWIRAIVMDESASLPSSDSPSPVGLACSLEPKGDGTLVGRVEEPVLSPSAGAASPSLPPPPDPRVGNTVRLDDPAWPKNARMLILGRVVAVEILPNQRKVITVRPDFELDRVTEIVLRITSESASQSPDESDAPGGAVRDFSPVPFPHPSHSDRTFPDDPAAEGPR